MDEIENSEPESFQDLPIDAQRFLLAMYSIAGRNTNRAVHMSEILAVTVEQGLMEMNQKELLDYRAKLVTALARLN